MGCFKDPDISLAFHFFQICFDTDGSLEFLFEYGSYISFSSPSFVPLSC